MRILNIELLRALAATLVLVSHVSENILASGGTGSVYEYVSFVGNAGVDLFFVISGFVITTSFWQNPRNSWAFLRARVRRVVPTYWILTLLAIAAILLSARVGLETSLTQPTVWTSIGSFLFVRQPIDHVMPVLAQGWTLEYEMLFYLVFTVAIFAKRHIALIASIAVIVLGLTLGYGWLVVEFATGVAVAAIVRRPGKPPRAIVWVLLALGILTLAFSIVVPYNENLRPLFWGLPSAAVVLSSAWLPQVRSRLAVVAGRISYPVYLIQWFVNPIVCLVAVKLGIIDRLSALVVVAAFVVTQAAAYVFDRWVDQPVKRGLVKIGF